MRRFLDRARASAAIAATRPVREPSAAAPAEVERAAAEEGGPPSPAHRHSVPQSPERRMRRAFQRFNASEQRRMVRGLIRSLGEPSVSALSSPSAPAEVRITVAWELAWYQWEVDIARDDAPLRELARGDEIGELSEGDRRWNGRANSEGELSVGLEEPEPGDG